MPKKEPKKREPCSTISCVDGGIPSQRVHGCENEAVAEAIVTRCAEACGDKEEPYGLFSCHTITDQDFSLANEVLRELKPQDGVEALLFAHLFALHDLGMRLLAGSSCADNCSLATKLFRVMHETLDAVLRWRRKGEQKVCVQHVSVVGGVGNLMAGIGGIVEKTEGSKPQNLKDVDAEQT